MGTSWCSACSDQDSHRYTGDDHPPNAREGVNVSQPKHSRHSKHKKYDDDVGSSSDEDGYDGSTSRDDDDDDKSVSSKALTDQDIEVAYDGWKKAIDSGNETLATFYCEEYPHIDMFQYRWDNGDSALMIACKNQKARLVFFLLTQGASVNEQNPQSLNTPLHYATLNRDEKIADLLLKWDADPNVMNVQKESPITIASAYRDQTMYRMLAGIKAASNSNLSADQPDFHRLKTNTDRLDALREATAGMVVQPQESEIDDILGGDDFVDDTDERYRGSTYGSKTGNNYYDVKKPSNADKENGQNEPDELSKNVALRANQVARRNPFSKLQRRPTELAKTIIKENLDQKPLPQLEAWLEKRKPGGVVPTYQKRWIVVKGAHMLWSAKQRSIVNDADRKERKKFNGSIHLGTIEAIQGIHTNADNKFMVKARDAKKGAMREYVFRCTNRRERDFWVQGLKEHKKQYQTVLNYLGK